MERKEATAKTTKIAPEYCPCLKKKENKERTSLWSQKTPS
jgi:hypothetical protein